MKETRNTPQILESAPLEGQEANRRTMLKSIFEKLVVMIGTQWQTLILAILNLWFLLPECLLVSLSWNYNSWISTIVMW
jgi:hypothetical protein